MTIRTRSEGAAHRSAHTHLVLIERRALCEPIVVETDPEGLRSRPTGFWRGSVFYRIVRVLERRWERGESYLRVLADRGCFDLHRVSDMDPWTWRTQGRWELIAELAAVPVHRSLF
ncbi:MAG TPA: hypothetical protein VKV57_09220 [bacterium]|nr:hypothetical protein [bacterium]